MKDADNDEALIPFKLVPYHEAAHAVVAWSLGLSIRKVSIKPDKTSLGRCYHSAGTKDFPDKRLLVALAGEAAAERISPGHGSLGTGRDRRVACRCALVTTKRDKAAARRLIGEKRNEVQRIVEAHWATILDLGSELSWCEHLTGRQAIKIIVQPFLLTVPRSNRPSVVIG